MTLLYVRSLLRLSCNRQRIAAVAGLLALPIPSALRAQVDAGTITITVADSSGARVPKANIRVTKTDTALVREVQTDTTGECVVSPLSPGSYSVAVSAIGFRDYLQQNLELRVQATVHLDIKLEVGEARQVVEVTGAGPILEAQTSSVGLVMPTRSVDALPLNGRNFVQLTYLTPALNEGSEGNVNSGQRPDNRRNTGSISAVGARFNDNNFTFDGIDDNDNNQNNVVSLPNIDAIQEFKVLTGVYPAEYGRNYGAQVLVVSKNGTNSLHGDAMEFLRNSKLDAKNFFDRSGPIPPFKQNQFGATLGGPVRKDKVWFFTDYQSFRLRQSVTDITTVPPAGLTQALNANQNVLVDPAFFGFKPVTDPAAAGAPFPGNIIPASRIDPVSAKLARAYPLPTNTANGANFLYTPVQTQNMDQFDIRIDQKLSDAANLFGRFSLGQSSNDVPPLLPTATVDGVTFDNAGASSIYPGPGNGNDRSLSIGETQILSPTKVNALRLGFNRWLLHQYSVNTARGNVAQRLGMPGVNLPGDLQSAGVPFMTITGLAPLGDENVLPLILASNTYQINDTFSWVSHHHTIKFGGDFRRMDINLGQLSNPHGSYNFSGIFTGYGVADFLLGLSQTTGHTFAEGAPAMRRWGYAGFVQDDWRVSSRLTLNLGLRWETFTPLTEKHNRLANFDFGGTNTLLIAGVNASATAGLPTDTNNFGPRFGYAYQLHPKLVLRGGFGVFYNLSVPEGFSDRIINNPPLLYDVTITTTNYTQAVHPKDGFVDPAPPYPTVAPNITYRNQPLDLATPYVLEYSTELQYQITQNMVLKVGYIGNVGRKVPVRLNLNQPYAAFGALAGLPVAQLRPLPQYGDIFSDQYVGKSSFNGLESSLEKRYSNGLDFMFAYTWAHSIDFACAPTSTASCGALVENSHNLEGNKGNSDSDMRHRFTAAWRYELPFGPGKKLFRGAGGISKRLAEGWSVGGMTFLQTGVPFEVVMATPNTGNGVAGRPDVNPNLAGCPAWHQTVHSWFNPCLFVTPPPGVWGDAGRQILRNPGRQNWDLSVFKDFLFHEERRLQFRSEFFNVWNHPNFQGPPGSAVSGNPASPLPAQGVITSAFASREIQFALKFYW